MLGPLATYAEPHSYDLCTVHAEGLTAPRGWDIVRLEPPEGTGPPTDDLVALAEAVRERGRLSRAAPVQAGASRAVPDRSPGTSRRGHLRVLRGGEAAGS